MEISDTSTSSNSKYSPAYVAIRKLRKKLRQIENLERCERALQQEEQDKVDSKYEIRAELNELVERYDYENDNSSDVVDGGVPDIKEEVAEEEEGEEVVSGEEVSGEAVLEEDEVQQNDYPTESHKQSSTQHRDDPDLPTSTSHPQTSVHERPDHDPVSSTSKQTTNIAGVTIKVEPETTKSDAKKVSPTKRKIIPGLPVDGGGDQQRVNTDDSKKPKLLKSDSIKSRRKQWSQANVTLTCIEGHNDLVTCVIVHGDNIISGSRDTTIKVHSLASSEMLYNLGGHTNTVTCVCLLSSQHSQLLSDSVIGSTPDQCIVSASLDCSLRIWSLNTGRQVKDVYTFHPVTYMTYIPENRVIVTGSEGGKIAVWDMDEGERIAQCTPYSDRVTALQYANGHIYSCCIDGEIRVHRVTRGQTQSAIHSTRTDHDDPSTSDRDPTSDLDPRVQTDLECVFSSENLRSSCGVAVSLSQIHSLSLRDGRMLIGDDGANLKILDWKTGLVRKLGNNVGEFGATDSICFNEECGIMLSSAYDIDHGLGYINLRTSKGGEYVTTLSSSDVGRITALACCHDNTQSSMCIVSGGEELILWTCRFSGDSIPESSETQRDDIIKPKYLAALARAAVDSDEETDGSDSEGEREVRLDSRRQLLSLGESEEGAPSLWAKCVIV